MGNVIGNAGRFRPGERPIAPARWLGWQRFPSGRVEELWNLLAAIPGYPLGSTVGRKALEDAGYYVPDPPEAAPNPQGRYRHTRKAAARRFDPKSLRTVRSGRHRVIVGCPKGKYSRPRRRCRVGTRAVALLHPNVPLQAFDQAAQYVNRLRGQAARRFAVAYLDHLNATPGAPDPRAFHVASDEAVQIRQALTRIMGAAYPNPDARWLRVVQERIDQLKQPRERDFARHYLKHLVTAQHPAPFHQDFDLTERRANKIRRRLAVLLGAAYPNPRRSRRGARTNPPRGRCRIMYPEGVMTGSWYGRHRNGKLYKHQWGRGRKWARVCPDGTVQIGAHRGRMWNLY